MQEFLPYNCKMRMSKYRCFSLILFYALEVEYAACRRDVCIGALNLISKPVFPGYMSLFKDPLQQVSADPIFMRIGDCQDSISSCHEGMFSTGERTFES
jgi:hypothetical protein